jgi:hypothetical protein
MPGQGAVKRVDCAEVALVRVANSRRAARPPNPAAVRSSEQSRLAAWDARREGPPDDRLDLGEGLPFTSPRCRGGARRLRSARVDLAP